MKLLVTGFPRFDAFPENATQQVIESMIDDLPAKLRPLETSIVFGIVDFENDDAKTQQRTMIERAEALMEMHHPDVCLFCGQAASRTRVELEAIAINIFKGDLIDPDGPPAYWATFPRQKELVEGMRAAEIPAALSYHAGTHLCNHILYTALRGAERTGNVMRCGFLHLPMTAGQVIRADENRPFLPLSMMRSALTLAIQHAFDHPLRRGEDTRR